MPVQADLTQEGLGFSPEIRKKLINELDIILASAASVDFGSLLTEILKIDYMGPVRMLAFAKECKKLQCLHHVSTAYVNYGEPSMSRIEDKIYPWLDAIDFELRAKQAMNCNPSEME